MNVRMVDESDCSSQDVHSPDDDVEETTVGIMPGSEVKALIKLRLSLSSGMSLNKGAPNVWKLETQGR